MIDQVILKIRTRFDYSIKIGLKLVVVLYAYLNEKLIAILL